MEKLKELAKKYIKYVVMAVVALFGYLGYDAVVDVTPKVEQSVPTDVKENPTIDSLIDSNDVTFVEGKTLNYKWH